MLWYVMKKALTLLGLGFIALANVACDTTNAKVGLPIPFTNPAVRVNLETQVTPLPPKVCVGLDVVED